MNFRTNKLPVTKKLVVFSACILIILLGFFPTRKKAVTGVPTDSVQVKVMRNETYQELSPDKSKKINRYEISNDPNLFDNNYTTYLDNNIIVAVTNTYGDTEREDYLFIGEYRTGDPHWLGNNYVFFTAYCGSSCQGLTLLDARTGQRWQAVLSSLPADNEQSVTHFHDWYDHEFEFNGLIQKIHAVMENNQPYLIFDIKNDKGVESGEKLFLFTGDSLILKE